MWRRPSREQRCQSATLSIAQDAGGQEAPGTGGCQRERSLDQWKWAPSTHGWVGGSSTQVRAASVVSASDSRLCSGVLHTENVRTSIPRARRPASSRATKVCEIAG
jgi:hypothetical protein